MFSFLHVPVQSGNNTILEAMKREPMLLSAERDKLIQGLRDAKFYDSFTYDDQTAEWFAT